MQPNEEMQLWLQHGRHYSILYPSCYLTFLPNNPTFDKFLTKHEQGFSDVSVETINSIDMRGILTIDTVIRKGLTSHI